MIKKIVLLLFLNLLIFQPCFSQKKTEEKDSVKIYHDIHEYSKKGKFSKFVYRLFFRPSKLNAKENKTQKKVVMVDYSKYNGKIIRNINIQTLDPFGYAVDRKSVV